MSSPAPAPLLVGLDLRCLAEGEMRGFSRYTCQLARHLSERPGIRLIGITDREVPFHLPMDVVRYTGRSEALREQVGLPRLISRLRLHVFLAPANRGLPLVSPRPTVLTLHDIAEWNPTLTSRPTGRHAARFWYSTIASLAGATRIITVSNCSAAEIASRLRISPRRIRVVYEAADDRLFRNPGSRAVAEVRSQYRIGPKSVLYLGGFDPKKDVPTLVRAFQRLDAELAPQLVLAGSLSHDTGDIRGLVTSMGLADRTTFTGFVPDDLLPALYRAVTCFAFPATAEGFGLPPVEAMATGLPVVAARAGALPEILGAGAGFFPPGDDRTAASLLEALLSSPQLRKRQADLALSRAAQFNWRRTATQTEEVLTEAARVAPLRRLGASIRAVAAAPSWVSRTAGG